MKKILYFVLIFATQFFFIGCESKKTIGQQTKIGLVAPNDSLETTEPYGSFPIIRI